MIIGCHNFLKIEGCKESIQRFVKQARNIYRYGDQVLQTVFSFQKFIPPPKELENAGPVFDKRNLMLIAKLGYDNWWDWCGANWGTNIDVEVASYDEKAHSFTFITEEEPPVKAIFTISKQYPSLKFTFEYKDFKYDDEEVASYGRFECQDGKIANEESSKIRAMHCRCNSIVAYVKLLDDYNRHENK